MAESRGKFRERQNAARLQAVDGKWPHEFPPVTEIGRVGHLGPQGVENIDLDILTQNYGGESKSSGQKAKNPGHRITLGAVATLFKGAVRRLVRPVYIISLPRHTLHAIDERQHYRFMVAWEWYRDRHWHDEEAMTRSLDEEIGRRLSKLPARYRKASDAAGDDGGEADQLPEATREEG